MQEDLNRLIKNHTRDFALHQYVYPVISRRSGGVSIGINLSPSGWCNFRCVYCQVDGEVRVVAETEPDTKNHKIRKQIPAKIDLGLLRGELRETLYAAMSGDLFLIPHFSQTPKQYRRVNDIAFSGEGEPTLSAQFHEAVQTAIGVRDELFADDVKIVLITNATTLHKPDVQAALDLMARSNGEIWAKLDAGTSGYYEKIDCCRVPFETILANITGIAKKQPIVIQTMLLRLDGEMPDDAEVAAYCGRLRNIVQQGGTIKLVQLYTVVRPPANAKVSPLGESELNLLRDRIGQVTGLTVEAYYGVK